MLTICATTLLISRQRRTKPFDAVDMLHALGNQPTALAMQTLGLLK
jgi:hypothetical protein